VRRNPVPVLLIAVAAGWFVRRISHGRPRRYPGNDIPVLNMGNARIYDPDVSPGRPMHDSLESRREMSARI
jgi:hypothetical protein